MDFKDEVRMLGTRVQNLKPQVQTEEATKNAFVMPFIKALGYDVFNPFEVVPEFVADIGIKQGEKVDYAILKDQQPIILIECKWHGAKLDVHSSQLFRYFHTTKAKFGILTNGIEYRLYTDLVEPNKMDEKPFFVFDITDLKDQQIEELKKFHKNYYDLNNIVNTASELKYSNELRNLISKELVEPSPEFVKYFAKEVYPGMVTQKILDWFTQMTKKSFNNYINDLITDRLKVALTKQRDQEAELEKKEEIIPTEPTIITTNEELESFYIIRSMLRQKVAPQRVTHRDNQTYFAVLLDDNNRKPLCRLYMNGSKKYIGLFDSNKKETRHEIMSLDDIFKYAQTIESMIEFYDKSA